MNHSRVLKTIRVAILSFLLLGSTEGQAFERGGTVVTLMTYNVENLFDTKHDEGKVDYTYLPLEVKRRSKEIQRHCRSIRNPYYRSECFNLDWDSETLKSKIENLSRVIKSANLGSSPDILVLQEVENMNVLKKLVDIGLKGEGYQTIALIEGPDRRGIDVGIISKYPPAPNSLKYHEIDLSDASKWPKRVTRGILETTFDINGGYLTVLANHWPSQGNSDETRVVAAKTLAEVIENARYPVVAAGDFNTTKSDSPHGINEYLLNPDRFPYLLDVEKVYFGEQSKVNAYSEHRGTHHYRGEWSSLDKIFVASHLVSDNCYRKRHCLKPMYSTYQVVKESWMLKDNSRYENIPWRFDAERKEGFSDHLPALIQLYVK